MDKTMFKGYVRELVREMIEEEVKRVLPKIIAESVKADLRESAAAAPVPKRPPLDRASLAAKLGLEPFRRAGDDDSGYSTPGPILTPPPGMEDNEAVKAINRDYSSMMKKLLNTDK